MDDLLWHRRRRDSEGSANFEMHKLLEKQLERLDISIDKLPMDHENWKKFLQFVSNAYNDSDQERYMHERIMENSSQELTEANEKLEKAQQIAQLGYWLYNREKDKVDISNNLHKLLGLPPTKGFLSYSEFLALVHESDRRTIIRSIQKVILEGGEFRKEIRIITTHGSLEWFYLIGHLDSVEKYRGKENNFISGIAMNITDRKKSEEDLNTLNQNLLKSARLAGMADVAVSVLHNVGNVLNSANVSLGLLHEVINNPYFTRLFSVIDLLKEHSSNLTPYLLEDPKGKLIPNYLVTAGDVLKNDLARINQELQNLYQYLNHVNEVISMQQSISTIEEQATQIHLPEIVDTALQISGNTFDEDNIKLNKQYDEIQPIEIDRSKLTQILINLIQNAKDAVISNGPEKPRKINIKINKGKLDKAVQVKEAGEPHEVHSIPTNIEAKNVIQIIVEDNGVGIAPDNLTRIFSFGFTTKINGHGFGLHSSALGAKELGGSLYAESEGLEKGAKFILTLPLKEIIGK